MTLAIAHSRGWLDYDDLVCTYWPEFAQNGKEKITVRQLLAHQAGLFALDEPLDKNLLGDLDRLADILARQKPAWEPGMRQAYHAVTLGFYEGELPSTHGFYDECMKGEVQFSLGFMKPNAGFAFGSPGSFGFPEAGGSQA